MKLVHLWYDAVFLDKQLTAKAINYFCKKIP